MNGAVSAIIAQFDVLFGKRSTATVFMIGFVAMIAIFVIAGIATGGRSVSGFLFDDKTDMMMDFFRNAAESRDLPYTLHHSVYPPLATIGYGIMSWLILPFTDISAYESLAYSMRDSQIGMALYFATVVIALYAVYSLLDRMSSRSAALKVSAVLVVLFSSPVIASIERGNCILAMMALVGFFLLFFRSDIRWLRCAAYISLTIASATELYPMVFWAVLLTRDDYRKALTGIAASALLVVIPFILTDGSILTLAENIGMVSAQWGTTSPTMVHLALTMAVGTSVSAAAVTAIGYAIVAAICAMSLVVFVSDKAPLWEKAMLCACVVAVLPLTSATMHASMFFIVPAFMFMLEEKEMNLQNWLFVILLIIILAPIPSLIGPVSGSYQGVIIAVKILAAAMTMGLVFIRHRRIRQEIAGTEEVSDASC